MAKRHHILVDPTQPSTPKQQKPTVLTDWELCILCQTETPGETLQCPLRSTKKPIGRGYASLAEDLLMFQDLQHMPMNLQLERLDDGSGIETTLMTNSAGWHKKCRLMFTKGMFDRQKRAETKQHTSASQAVNTRFSHLHPKTREPTCLFCDQPAGSEGLHEAATKQLDEKVRECACELQDTALLAKLAAEDMIAIEAKYHNKCLCALYNRARQASPRDNDEEEDSSMHGIAFAELVVFMEDMSCDEDSAAVFKLSDLVKLCKDRLEQLGVSVDSRIHSTRLKNRLIAKLPELRAHSEGRETLLTFQKNIGPALKKACDHDSDAMHLVRAARVVRRDMSETRFSFDGSFQADCQKDAVPPSLLALVSMILDGSNIKHQTEQAETTTTSASLSISQLLVFNSVKHARKESSGHVRHNQSTETPLPLYRSMKIHAATRSRGLVDTLHSLGMCVSYDRLLQLSSDITNGICQCFQTEDVVCPSNLRKNLFTTAAVDNIDHNPSSATAKDSFYGTGISLIQHPSHTHAGLDRGVPVLNQDRSSKSTAHLPSAYTSVPPAAIKTKNFNVPAVQGPVRPTNFLATAVAVALKSDCGLFSRLYISCQTRHGDLDEFFSHENHAAPPALSTGGQLRVGVKADLLHCLESSHSKDEPLLDATVLDGAAIVQMLNFGTSKTFQEYADTVFAPYISTQLKKNWRVDLVWDMYLPDSLKGATRQKRGTGTRKRVSPSAVMPKNWKEFLRVDGNKTELFVFLSEDVTCRPQDYGKELYATRGSDVLHAPTGLDVSNLAPCSHEEADTRLVLHVADAVMKGHKRVGIRTVDTDVLVLAVASFDKIMPDELWVILGTGSNLRYIAVHELVATMDPRCCSSLPIFHALTGCDTVSSFSGRGKKTAWATWKAFPEVTDAFVELKSMPSEVSKESMSLLERFVVLMYDRTSDIMEVNEAKKQLFAHKGRTLENVPPTQAALKQHIKRACYQANIWNQSSVSQPELLNPSDWGWTKDTSGWQPLWTTLPEAAKSCQELIRCGCKTLCTEMHCTLFVLWRLLSKIVH